MQKTPGLGLLSIMPQIKFQRKSAGFVVSKNKSNKFTQGPLSNTALKKKLFLDMVEVTDMEKL